MSSAVTRDKFSEKSFVVFWEIFFGLSFKKHQLSKLKCKCNLTSEEACVYIKNERKKFRTSEIKNLLFTKSNKVVTTIQGFNVQPTFRCYSLETNKDKTRHTTAKLKRQYYNIALDILRFYIQAEQKISVKGMENESVTKMYVLFLRLYAT